MIVLTNRVRFYVPSTHDVNGVIDTEEFETRWHDVLYDLSENFGGATAFDGVGGYISDTAGFIQENVKIVEAFVSDDRFEDAQRMLGQWAMLYCTEWGQETIAYEVNNKLVIVGPGMDVPESPVIEPVKTTEIVDIAGAKVEVDKNPDIVNIGGILIEVD